MADSNGKATSAGTVLPVSQSSDGNRLKLVLCVCASILGISLVVICFYPGYMSADSVGMLARARSGFYEDWNPPVMTWLWGKFDHVIPGPVGMLLFHNLLFWSGLCVISYLAIRATPFAPVAILALGLFPPIFALLGTIWRDVGMGATLLFALAMLLLAEQRRSPTALGIGLLGLYYACAVRHNALSAVVPIAIWAGVIVLQLFFPAAARTRLRVTGIGVCLIAAFWGLARGTSRLLVQDRAQHIEQVLMVHDLVAISLATDRVRLPGYLAPAGQAFSAEELREMYLPWSADPLFHRGTKSGRRVPLTTDPKNLVELREMWLAMVPRNLGSYLHHRWGALKVMLGIGESEVCYPYQLWIWTNSLGVTFHKSQLNTWVMNRLSEVKNTLLFRAWLYVVLLSLFSMVCVIIRPRNAAIALASVASGLLYMATYFFIAPSCDFRYSWWAVITALLVPVTILSGKVAKPDAEGHEDPKGW